MTELIINAVTENVLEMVIAILSIVVSVYLIPLIKTELKPWLEEKRLYNITKKFVQAAEKLAESGVIPKIDKKAKVIELLEARGITITPVIEGFIEAAVKELDLVTGTVINTIEVEDIEIE